MLGKFIGYIVISVVLLAHTSAVEADTSSSEQACMNKGWQKASFKVGDLDRKVMWKAPKGPWVHGAIVVLHGGGGKADDFCTGGKLVQPQIAFTNMALENGFAVFALDSTNNVVTDAQGRVCGKRFDFAVNDRPNIDLPYIEHVLTSLIPGNRPSGSSEKIFMTGLSTGGYMTIRASTHFDNLVTAFAPISAGDPYGTDPQCQADLSVRKSAVGILVDRETKQEIVKNNACVSRGGYPNESPWESQNPSIKPTFKQFHNKSDGIVDYSCAQKAHRQLVKAGYPDAGPYVLNMRKPKNALYHLWLRVYNEPLIDFFKGNTQSRPRGLKQWLRRQ